LLNTDWLGGRVNSFVSTPAVNIVENDTNFLIQVAAPGLASISASYKDGILLLELPKKEEAQVQPSRLIEIG